MVCRPAWELFFVSLSTGVIGMALMYFATRRHG